MDGGFSAQYRAKDGAHVTKAQVARIGRVIDQLNADGGATPERLEKVAQDPSSPIHHDFEWDAERGAYKYRLVQARYYLRSIVVEYITEEGDPIELRAFNPIEYANGDVQWTSIRDSSERNKELDELIQRARSELRAFRKKFRALRVLGVATGLMKSIDDFLE